MVLVSEWNLCNVISFCYVFSNLMTHKTAILQKKIVLLFFVQTEKTEKNQDKWSNFLSFWFHGNLMTYKELISSNSNCLYCLLSFSSWLSDSLWGGSLKCWSKRSFFKNVYVTGEPELTLFAQSVIKDLPFNFK